MQPKRDIAIFVGSAFAYSVALSALLWRVPVNSFLIIAVTSIILSARGVSWRRKAMYAGISLGVFLALDYAFTLLGLRAYVIVESSGNPIAWIVGLLYPVIALTFPFVVLLLFVGREPSVLWTKGHDRHATSKKQSQRRR